MKIRCTNQWLGQKCSPELRSLYTYDAQGNLVETSENDMQTEVLYGNGLRTSYTYDERSQLTGMETAGMSNPLFRGTYAYDENGCRISKTEQIRMNATIPLEVMETCYTYDSMERLTKENEYCSIKDAERIVFMVLGAVKTMRFSVKNLQCFLCRN